MRRRLVATGLVLFLTLPAIAQTPATNPPGANPAQSPPVRTSQFGDWLLTCRSAANATPQSPQNCELVQTITAKGQKDPFAQIAIGRVSADQPLQFTVLVPVNVAFSSNVGVVTGDADKAPVNLTWARCMTIGCFATTALKGDIQKKWSVLETQGRVSFKAANGQDISMPISFKGLKSALEALNKEK